MQRDFIMYEKAMGLPRMLIIFKSLLRNALTSTVAQIGLLFGSLLAGAVVTEQVFDWPGLRLYAYDACCTRFITQEGDTGVSVLAIDDLVVDFDTDDGLVQAIDHLSLSVQAGEIVGLVGESGCGKTTVARCILGVLPRPPAQVRAGAIRFQGQDVLNAPEAQMTGSVRGKAITFIPQEPQASLNPLFPVGVQLR
jgi:ABC-type multidrug transport system fused ATPase/permease subunit